MVGCLWSKQQEKQIICFTEAWMWLVWEDRYVNVEQMAARNSDIKTDAMPPFYILHVTHVQYQANPASTF